MTSRRQSKKSESSIQGAIQVAISQAGGVALRINAGTFLVGDRAVKGAPSGFSDLLVLLPSARAVFVEVKSATGKQRPSQEHFEALVTFFGFKYAVVRSVSEALSACGL